MLKALKKKKPVKKPKTCADQGNSGSGSSHAVDKA